MDSVGNRVHSGINLIKKYKLENEWCVLFPSAQQRLRLSVKKLKMFCTQWVWNCYSALQLIIMDAERFNQCDIIASFMPSFQRHSSSTQLSLSQKSADEALFGQTLVGMLQFDIELGHCLFFAPFVWMENWNYHWIGPRVNVTTTVIFVCQVLIRNSIYNRLTEWMLFL